VWYLQKKRRDERDSGFIFDEKNQFFFEISGTFPYPHGTPDFGQSSFFFAKPGWIQCARPPYGRFKRFSDFFSPVRIGYPRARSIEDFLESLGLMEINKEKQN
jgi:hypothetical protein